MQKPLHEKRTLLLTALCALAMTAALYALLGVWPFGGSTVLTGDLNGQYINFDAAVARALQSGGDGFFYTLQKHMGGSMLGILAYYCASPFNLLYLVCDVVHYAQMAGLVLALKLVCTCVTMAFFLGRHTPQLRHRAVLPALCYGFCAYALVYAQNVMWLDVILLLPLVCYGIDVLLRTGRPFVFSLWLALAIITNFYIAYMACIFAVLYFLYGALCGVAGDVRCFLRRCGSFAFGALCAGGLSAALLLPAMTDISSSKGLAAGFTLKGGVCFKFTEFFYRLLPFNFTWADVESGLPNVYCGALIVVCLVLFFCGKGVSLREKLAGAAVLLLLFVTLYSVDAMLAMHGFVKPVWFPYRHSFLFCFWLCFLAGRTLALSRLTWPRAAVAAVCGCAFLAVCFLVRNEWFTATLFGIGALLCVAYLALLFAVQRAGSRRVRGACLAACGLLCVAELTMNAFYDEDQFEKYSVADYAAFVSEGESLVQSLDAESAALGTNAFRAEKTWFRSYNDPLLLGYRGLSHFSSTQGNVDSDWVGRMGFGSANTYAAGSTALGEALTALRYVFARPQDDVPAHLVAQASLADDVADVAAYENPYALPFAFAIDEAVLTRAEDVPAYDWTSIQTFDTQNAVFAALSGETQPLFTEISDATAEADGAPCALTGDFGAQLAYTVQVPTDGLVYAVLESKQGRPAQYVVSTGATGGCFAGWPAGVLQLGRCTAGDTVTLTLTAEWGLMDISRVRFAVLDEALLAAYTQAANATAPAQQTLTQGTFTAQTSTDADTLLAVLLPYDANLRVTVDDKTAECLALFDDLCAVRVPAGQHTVRLAYRVPRLVPGVLLSLLAAVALLAAFIWLKRKKKENEPCLCSSSPKPA